MMLLPEEALTALRAVLTPREAIRVPLADAHQHTLAADAHAMTALPPFTQSAMDGYAVYRADLERDRCLPVAGESAAAPVGTWPTLAPGTTMRVFTGGPIPKGADAVVMQERVTRDGDQATFTEVPAAGANIRREGEEVTHGQRLLSAGTLLGAAQLGALAMAGVASVDVRRRPVVHAWVGGDEIVDAGVPLAPGQVYDANGPLVRAWFAERGIAVAVRRMPDDRDAVAAALDASLREADLVVTTGGVSVGDHDHVVPAAEAVGAARVFWRVAQKPGKPLYLATREHALLLGLPGNPGAVFVGLTVYAQAALAGLEGARPPAWSTAVLRDAYPATGGRAHFVRVQVTTREDGVREVAPLPKQASHMLSNLATCDGLAWLPASSSDWAAGTVVRWCPA